MHDLLRLRLTSATVGCMVTPVTAFRFTERELAQLDRLGEELLCNRTDVLRYAVAAFRDSPAWRSQIAADNTARAFLQNLRTQYGSGAVLELEEGSDNNWRLAGQPLDQTVANVAVKQQGDRWVLDLIDPNTGVGIHNALSWNDKDGNRHAVVSLRDLWVHSQFGAIGEPVTRQLWDGRTVVQLTEDSGSTRYIALGNDGSTTVIEPGMVPEAAFPLKSVAVGIRRESDRGPHLGAGYGGAVELTGHVDIDRGHVVEVLQRLLERAERGDFDDILDPNTAKNRVGMNG